MNDPTTIRIAILLPLIQMIIFGYGINMDVQHVDTIILNEDRRPEATKLLDALEATTYMKIRQVAYSKDEVLKAMRRGAAKVGVIIPPDYSNNIQQGREAQFQVLLDGGDSNVATQVLGVVNQVGAVVSQSTNGPTQPVRITALRRINAVPHVLYNPDLKTTFFTIPGLLGVVLLNVTLFLTLLALVREREQGTMDQLLVTPLNPAGLVVGKISPYIVLGFFDFNLVLIAQILLFQVPIRGSILLLEFCAFLFLASTLGLGLLISARASTQMQAAQIAQLVILPSIMLSGFVFSVKSMPPLMQLISYSLPMTYFLETLRGIILRGATLQDIGFQVTMMCLIGGGILTASIFSFKRQVG